MKFLWSRRWRRRSRARQSPPARERSYYYVDTGCYPQPGSF